MVISEYAQSSINSPIEVPTIPWPLEKNKIHFQPVPIDMTVQCPKCKTIETVQLVQGKLLPCSKFSQENGKVFHSCGSHVPCRLYR
jgi:hypothetical protein